MFMTQSIIGGDTIFIIYCQYTVVYTYIDHSRTTDLALLWEDCRDGQNKRTRLTYLLIKSRKIDNFIVKWQ